MKTLKSIDISGLKWFDEQNGNTYHAGHVTINADTPQAQTFAIQDQYGYGSQFEYSALETLEEFGVMTDRERYTHGGAEAPWAYCDKRNIALRITCGDCGRRRLEDCGREYRKQIKKTIV